MKAVYINPIYIAARDVFQNMFSIELERGNLQVDEKIVPRNSINVSIGITGDLTGIILFSFPEEMVFNLVEEMSGMEFKEFDKFMASAIGELANIITGNAMSNLSESGYSCDIVPPQITVGVNKSFSTASKKILIIPMQAERDSFDLFISIKE